MGDPFRKSVNPKDNMATVVAEIANSKTITVVVKPNSRKNKITGHSFEIKSGARGREKILVKIS